MKKFNLEGYSVEVDNKWQSKQLQEMAFEQGFEWDLMGSKIIVEGHKFFIFTKNKIYGSVCHDMDLYQIHFNEILLKEEAKKRGYTADNFKCLKGFKSVCIESIDDWTYHKYSDTLYANSELNGGKVVYKKGVWAKMKSKTLEQQLLEAEAEVKRLKEEINKPKIGDWAMLWEDDEETPVFGLITNITDFYLTCNGSWEYAKKITNKQLIELLENELQK